MSLCIGVALFQMPKIRSFERSCDWYWYDDCSWRGLDDNTSKRATWYLSKLFCSAISYFRPAKYFSRNFNFSLLSFSCFTKHFHVSLFRI